MTIEKTLAATREALNAALSDATFYKAKAKVAEARVAELERVTISGEVVDALKSKIAYLEAKVMEHHRAAAAKIDPLNWARRK
jgi:hypothetical protein